MLKNSLLLSWLIGTCLQAAAHDPVTKVPAPLKTVTVYRQGAALEHLGAAVLKAGSNELIIQGLSNTIDLNSLQVNCVAAVTIMGMEFRQNYLNEQQPTALVQILKDSVRVLEMELEKIAAQTTVTLELIDLLKTNRDLKGQQNGVSVSELVKLMDYYKTRAAELQQDLQAQKHKQQVRQAQLTKLQLQIAEEEKKNTRQTGELALQLSVAIEGKYDFTISYLTPNANWTPYYDVRVDNINEPLKLIYKCRILQTTGLDWKKVKLSLATSTPAKWGDAPELKSWFLGYVDPTLQTRQLLQGKLAGVNIENSANLNEVVVVGYGAASKDREYEEKTPAYIVNGSIISETAFRNIRATTIKDKQRISPSEAIALYGSRASGGAVVITLKEGLADYVTETDNQLNVVFDIELPYDVPSNGKAQTAVLKETKVPATYQYFAVPKADAQAYLLADIHGWSALNLLPGEANIIFEGTYVGKSFIDPQSTLDTLHLTLARDKRVIIRREKLTDFSSTKFIGNNKLQKLTYEITIRNNKKEIVTLTMKDQYPLATTKDIEVELLEHGTAIVDKETGMLHWFFQLKPGETKKIRIGYSVKYSKYKMINLN